MRLSRVSRVARKKKAVNEKKPMFKVILNVVLFVLFLLLQYSFAERITFFGVKPNLPVVIVIVTGIVGGSGFGGIAGLIAGLYQDAMTGKILGMYALFGLYAGVLPGKLSKKHKNENVLVVLLLTYVISVLYEGCIYLFGYMLPIVRNGWEVRAGIVYAFARIILPVAALNTLVGLPVFLALKDKKTEDTDDDMERI